MRRLPSLGERAESNGGPLGTSLPGEAQEKTERPLDDETWRPIERQPGDGIDDAVGIEPEDAEEDERNVESPPDEVSPDDELEDMEVY